MDAGGGIRLGKPGNPCDRCRGSGVRLYGSSATWRGGMGCAAMTYDQCDECWGSGDADRHWPNLRAYEASRRAWEAEQCAKWLAANTGCELKLFRGCLSAVVGVIEKEARRRKPPDGKDAFWYARAAEQVAVAMRRLIGEEDDDV